MTKKETEGFGGKWHPDPPLVNNRPPGMPAMIPPGSINTITVNKPVYADSHKSSTSLKPYRRLLPLPVGQSKAKSRCIAKLEENHVLTVDAGSDSDPDLDSRSDPDPDWNLDQGSDSDSDSDPLTDPDADPDSDQDTDAHSDSRSNLAAGPDPDSDVDLEIDSHRDSDLNYIKIKIPIQVQTRI